MSKDEDEPVDHPINAVDGSTPRWAGVVINLADVRVRYGFPAGPSCVHHDLTYCTSERRIWCNGCKRTIDSFDAFMVLARNFHDMLRDVTHRENQLQEALEHNVTSRAAKEVDKLWRSRRLAPCCPHCRAPLLPEDFAGGVRASVSAELERQRRKKARKP